ncbi:MAG: hypothetical protein NMK33_06700 (plasmid) [Candidatus Cardinium sp.]|nr:MAG: hypothetical protein NMK33_06700 [Candidatus Cardinium sp.]
MNHLRGYKLKFPNQEVEKAFTQTVKDALERRVKDYFISTQDQIKSTLQAKDIESFIIAINIAFSSIPYYITSKTEKIIIVTFICYFMV